MEPLSTLPAVLATAVVAWALVADLRHDLRRLVSGRSVVLVGIVAWFLLEAMMLSEGLQGQTQDVYNFGVFCVLVATIGFLAGYHGSHGSRVFEPVALRFRRLDEPRVLWRVVLVCSVIGLAPVVYYSGLQLIELFQGIFGMRQTWGGLLARGRYGDSRAALLMLENFVTGAGPFAVILLLDRRTSWLQKVYCGLIALWPMMRAYGSGTRTFMLTTLLPVLAILYFKSSPRAQRRMIITGLLSFPIVYTFMAAMVASRSSGEFSWEAAKKAPAVGHEMFQELLFITTHVPEPVEYQLGYSYYVQLVNPIPRFLWAGKPTLDAGILMAQARGQFDRTTGEAYLTIAPGLIGEMYLNFGLPGVLLVSVFGGWLVRSWDRLREQHSGSLPVLVLYSAGLATLFVLGRAFNMSLFYGILFLCIGVYLLTSSSRGGPAASRLPVRYDRPLPARLGPRRGP